MTTIDPRTHAQRLPPATLQQQTSELAALEKACTLLDTVPCVLLILNSARQVVLANQRTRQLLNLPSVEAIYGLRPGEVFDCQHVCKSPEGCGTTVACASCGAAISIAIAEGGNPSVQECRLTRTPPHDPLDLQASATPFRVDDQTYTVLTLSDISHEKRRRALERIFFHDLLNTASAIAGTAALLPLVSPTEQDQLTRNLRRLSATLAEEIRAQRDLLAAEENDLQLRIEPLSTGELLQQALAAAEQLPIAAGRRIVLDPATRNLTFDSDRTLLLRVLGNMLKNALEACPANDRVTLGCTSENDHVIFWVHNPTAIPPAVETQLFQRSFSTKSPDRGLGLYSIKLLTERYLAGSISYQTSPTAGTTFRARYPLHPPTRIA